MKNHGIIRRGLSLGSSDNLYYILENENNEFFLVKDQERFEQASSSQKFSQKIHRFISRTAFIGNITAELYAYSTEEKATMAVLHEHFDKMFGGTDDKLKAVISLCEGADSSDVDIFKWISEVVEYSEIKDMSNLRSGLGFPGKGIGLLVCKQYFPYEETIVYMQKVSSYMEGYAVDHYRVLPEMIAAIKADLINVNHF